MNLQISLLGQFRVESQGTVWHLESPRHILLLALLSLHPNAPRARLAGLLWPDSTEEQARTNLRNLLHHLKKACPQLAALLELDGQSIRWKSAATLEVDVHRFRAALTAARSAADAASRLCHLQQAADWYRGELLPGFYEDWVLTEREDLHQRYLDALTQLAKLYEETRQYPEAIESLNRFLRADPLNEAACAHSMRLHALN